MLIIRFLRYLKMRFLPPSSRSFHAVAEKNDAHLDALETQLQKLNEGFSRLTTSCGGAAEQATARLDALAAQLQNLDEGFSRLTTSCGGAAEQAIARLDALAAQLQNLDEGFSRLTTSCGGAAARLDDLKQSTEGLEERLVRMEQTSVAEKLQNLDLLSATYGEIAGLRVKCVAGSDSVFADARKIYDLLEDEPSKKLFSARLLASSTGRYGTLFRALTDLDRHEEKPDILTLLKKNRDGQQTDRFVLCPVSERTQMLQRSMAELGISVQAFCTHQSAESESDEIPVIDYETLAAQYSDCYVLLENNIYFEGMDHLNRVQFPMEQVLIDCVSWAPEYFGELLTPMEHEVFIDGGAYDGDTIRDFLAWNGGVFDRLIAFEPDREIYDRCQQNVKPLADARIEVHNSALWGQNTQLHFDSAGNMGSHADANASETVDAVRLDDVLDGQPATIIKLDVEGAELQALIGAAKTIQRYKPRLLVCVYHKPEDILELLLYIKKLNPAYKLYLRHASTSIYDTLLIAESCD